MQMYMTIASLSHTHRHTDTHTHTHTEKTNQCTLVPGLFLLEFHTGIKSYLDQLTYIIQGNFHTGHF